MNSQELKNFYGGAIKDPKVRAWLKTLQHAEGTTRRNPMDSYRVMFGGGQFNDLSKHPDRVVHGGEYSSAAAGAYQFMPDTWAGVVNKLDLKDFGPESQDLAALHLIRERYLPFGGLAAFQNDLKKGDIRTISNRLAREWASLPTFSGNSAYGQPVKKLDDLQTYYNEQLKNPPQLPGALAAASQSPQKPQNTTPPAAGAGTIASSGIPGVTINIITGKLPIPDKQRDPLFPGLSDSLDPLGLMQSIYTPSASGKSPMELAQQFLRDQIKNFMGTNYYNEDTG